MKATIIYEGKVIKELPKFYENDFGQHFKFHIKNKSDAHVDLEGYTILIKAINIHNKSILFTGECLISGDDIGVCEYIIANEDFSLNGTYELELELESIDYKGTIPLGYLILLKDF